MDRNEKQNSFRNIQNSRGFDKKLKKYKIAFHISLAAAVIFAGSTGALGVQYLKNQDTETETKEVETASADNDKNDTAETENAKGKATDTTDETKEMTGTETLEDADVTPTGDPTETPTPTPKDSQESAQVDEFKNLSNNLENDLPKNTEDISIHISGIGKYAGENYREISAKDVTGCKEYAKLFIVGKIYDMFQNGPEIRETKKENETDSDLAKIILAALNRNSEEVYKNVDEKSSLELLLRIGEEGDDQKKQEDEQGYVGKDSEDYTNNYNKDIKNGVERVNTYIQDQLATDKKTIESDLTNKITLGDCETYMGELLTKDNEYIKTMCGRLSEGEDEAGIVSAVPTDENPTKIWISGVPTENKKITIIGVCDAEGKKGYILSILYSNNVDKNKLSSISSTVYDTLIGSTE